MNFKQLEGKDTRPNAPFAAGYSTRYSETINCSAKNMHLTKVERFILDFVAKENPDPELLAQIESLEVASREHTGVGLYANFEFPDRDSAHRISSPRVPY